MASGTLALLPLRAAASAAAPASSSAAAEAPSAAAGGGAPFAILRRDDSAHIVRDRDTGILAAVCFEPVSQTGLEIAGVSRPAIVMLRDSGGGGRVLSVCDPDLHLYEGDEPDQRGADGSQREVSIYSRAWIGSPGAPSVVRVTLAGAFVPARPDPRVRLLPPSAPPAFPEPLPLSASSASLPPSAPLPSRPGVTVLEFTCRDGLPVEITLAPGKTAPRL
ncbi:MAG: polysaccharide lyase beta-sandwich domain-containing protein [Opitutaceae bacterium]|jgi:hypothetical protein|nr:polysaccharide lyase beta-sandwich domain-containing protein [Opitutaceae bacterium]